MSDVAVIGAGVIGLSCAHELAQAGHRVRVVSDGTVRDGVSAVAGGLWFPYRAEPVDRVLPWALRSLERFAALADDPSSGVRLAPGLVVDRIGQDEPWWAVGLDGVRPAEPDELPAGVTAAHVFAAPLITMSTYLAWLLARCRGVGVDVEYAHVDRIGDVSADLVIVAAGIRSGRLTGDHELMPIRGQVVRVTNPGLDRWVVDSDHPAGPAYVLPHGNHVVCGGTADVGESDETIDPDVERAILARCSELVPELARAHPLSRAVGLRPGAPSVRLDRRSIRGRDVITCYGHGGAGVTISWGCAEEVVKLAAPA